MQSLVMFALKIPLKSARLLRYGRTMREENINLKHLIEMATAMVALADKGNNECRDENCVSLFGLAKDCAYRVRTAAVNELASHEERDLKRK
jgi:hypothetical protein